MSNPTPHLTQLPPLDNRTPDEHRHDAEKAAGYAQRRLRQLAKSLAWLILAILLAAALFSCRPVRYIPVETVRTEVVRQSARDSVAMRYVTSVRDSIVIRDSLVITLAPDGTTARTDTWHIRERLRIDTIALASWKLRFDSLASARIDTIRVPVPVEKPLSKWQSYKLRLGGFALVGLALLFVLAVLHPLVSIRNSLSSKK